MKKELEELQPDISNIIYRGLAKYVPDSQILLVDDVSTELVNYISERLVENLNICKHKQHWRTPQDDGTIKKVCCKCEKELN